MSKSFNVNEISCASEMINRAREACKSNKCELSEVQTILTEDDYASYVRAVNILRLHNIQKQKQEHSK